MACCLTNNYVGASVVNKVLSCVEDVFSDDTRCYRKLITNVHRVPLPCETVSLSCGAEASQLTTFCVQLLAYLNRVAFGTNLGARPERMLPKMMPRCSFYS